MTTSNAKWEDFWRSFTPFLAVLDMLQPSRSDLFAWH